MPQADPFIDNPKQRPYECLGIPQTASYEQAKEAVKRLHGKHKTQAKKNEGINEENKKRHQTALRNIKLALESIKEGWSINIADAPETLEIGEKGEVKVTNDQGAGVGGIEIIYNNTTLDTTNENGVAHIRFQELNEKPITARAGDDETAETTIKITERSVNLELKVSKESIQVGEDVEFKVVDQNHREVADVNVDIENGPSKVTDDDGKVEVVFNHTGEYDITLSKTTNTHKVTYEDTSTSVAVEPGEAEFKLNEIKGELVKGNKVSVQITTKQNRVVEGAVVKTNHDGQTQTNSEGWAEIELKSNNNIVIRVSKDSERIHYEDFQTTLVVRERKPEIYIKYAPDFATAGEKIRFKVVDQDQNPIKNARIVSTKQKGEWFSDANGQVIVPVNDRPGPEVFTADKLDQEFDNGPAELRLLIQS